MCSRFVEAFESIVEAVDCSRLHYVLQRALVLLKLLIVVGYIMYSIEL